MSEMYSVGMAVAIYASKFSHDPDTQTGCAVLEKDGRVLARGSNRIPNGIEKTIERTTRPEKYNWIEHAERTAIYNNIHVNFNNTIMFLNWFPCKDCARAIVSVGIRELVYMVKPERWADPRYEFDKSKEILEAGGVKLTPYVEG